MIKNRAKYKIEIGDFILKSNHISYVEKTNKIIIFVAISNKLEIITFELNDELCKAAQSQIEEFSKDPEGYKNYRSVDELGGIVPKHYLKENPVLIVDDGAEEPYEVLNKFLLNKLDPIRLETF